METESKRLTNFLIIIILHILPLESTSVQNSKSWLVSYVSSIKDKQGDVILRSISEEV